MGDYGGNDSRWRDLMSAAQAGDRAAYGSLLTEVTPLIRNACRRKYSFLGREDVEDIVQDVLLAVHTVRSTYDPSRPFLPWLLTITHNRAVDTIRRLSRRSAREMTVAEYPETLDGAEANLFGEGYGDPEALRLAVSRLPERQRKAVEMLRFREMSLKEAAEQSGMTVGALKIAVHRATQSLRVVLSRRGERGD
jgi:RNA polymerase sigma-70 factor (ECF subfamily)